MQKTARTMIEILKGLEEVGMKNPDYQDIIKDAQFIIASYVKLTSDLKKSIKEDAKSASL